VRITCQLINALTAAHIWADRFDSNLDDIFDLQDRVTESVAGAMEPTLRNAEIERAANKPTKSLDAYDLYLRALYHYYLLTRKDLEAGLSLLRNAIKIDSGYAMAKALAAVLLSFIAVDRLLEADGAEFNQAGSDWFLHEVEEAKEAIALAREALANARDDPTTLRLAGHTLAYLARDNQAGRMALDRALILNPNSAQILSSSAWIHLYAGEWSLARDKLVRSIRLSPLDPEMRFTLTSLSAALVELGEVEQALDAARKATAMGYGRSYLIWCLVLLGRIDEAREEVKTLLRTRPSYSLARWVRLNSAFPESYISRRIALFRAAGIPE
jgi:adenylate cyclase